jgi:DNA-binding winged helix-turn-helix (wHTH) protein/TolB-like protein/Tfp pilus assembly protein PilF
MSFSFFLLTGKIRSVPLLEIDLLNVPATVFANGGQTFATSSDEANVDRSRIFRFQLERAPEEFGSFGRRLLYNAVEIRPGNSKRQSTATGDIIPFGNESNVGVFKMSLENVPDLLLNISDANVKPEQIHSYRFKSFTLRPMERQLVDGDRPLSLTPKAFDILTLLIENAGHLVTKEELLQKIWAESFVEEANLARLIHTIRKTLGEDENGNKFIETVPTKGYRFVASLDKVVVQREEGREGTATNGSKEVWPDRLESTAELEARPLATPVRDRKTPSRWVLAALSILGVVGLVAAFAQWRSSGSNITVTKDQPISIAVLPFRPISTAGTDPAYELAFANSIIADLNQSKNLRVRPFSTMRMYMDLTQDPIAIGQERGTDYVLESNYLSTGGRLQVTANLFNVKTGSVDGTFQYEGDDTDLYAAGRNVAAKIVPNLLATLNLPASVPGNRGTENEKAWRSYLQGMILSNKRTVEDAEKALDEFNNAIRLDPNYAMAYMGFAHALQTKLTNGGGREELCGPARNAEKKALELDPALGDAWGFLATNRILCTWEIAQAETEYRRAVELSPNSANVRRFYAVNIANEKRFDEALEHLRIASDLDPNNPFNVKLVGRVLFFARRWDEAIEQSVKAMALVPEAEQTSFVYMSYEMKGDLEKAFEWFLIVKKLDGENEEDLNAWRKTYAESGWQGVLQRRLQRDLEEEKTTDNINKHARLLEEISTLSVQLGDYDRAFEYINKATDSYVLYSGQLPVNPYLDPVRSDPRFKAIMARTWNSHGGNWE